MNKENKISNFRELINENQESIKFLESKVAFITVLTGAMTASIIEKLEIIFERYSSYSLVYKISLALLIIFISICIYLIIKIVLPKQNPIENLPEPYKSYHNIYLDKITDDNQLEIPRNYEDIFKSLKTLSKSLELEFLKLSYIRNYKNKWISILTKFLIATLVLFAINILIEKYENKLITGEVENSCCEK